MEQTVLRLLHITYYMRRGGEKKTSELTLPISEERYAEFDGEIGLGKKARGEIWKALENLADLQGYKLGGWGFRLENIGGAE